MRELIKDIINRLRWVESDVKKLKESSGSSTELSPVATSGSYNDLTDKPTIPAIPAKMASTEANTGTATTQRTIDAVTLKGAIQTFAPAPPTITTSLTGLAGYNAAETQSLKNVAGTLTWVTDPAV